MKKTFLFTLLLLLILNTLAVPVSATSSAPTVVTLPASAFNSGGLDAPRVTPLTGNRVLLMNRNGDDSSTLQMLDTSLHTVVWGRTLKLYDLAVVTVSKKIVLLTEENKALKKLVLDYDGKVLSSDNFRYALKLPKNTDEGFLTARWSAPSAGEPERIAIVNNGQFQLFQSPWLSSQVNYSLKLNLNDNYEDIRLLDVNYPGYPYVVMKYQGSGIGSTTYFLRIINLFSKQEYSLPFGSAQRLGGHDIIYQLNGKNLLVGTSHEERLGATISNPEALQPVFYTYQLATGKLINSLTANFVPDQDVYGWKTQLFGNTLFVQDLNNNSWRIYDITQAQAALATGEAAVPLILLQVNVEARSAVFLAPDGDDKAAIKTVKF
ncbi:hypothetical protein [Paenibacillus sp. GCM10012306]|uniref:hypothetical protein n=1 Tax=Paenibacillus sp. GCM10012306 TaxID=3317342 RepID=UPI003622C846